MGEVDSRRRALSPQVHAHQLVLVAFGAPWCPWSQRLEPVWRKTYEELKAKPYGERVRLAKVDCTAPSSQPLCQKQHIHAFPTIRIYRQALVHAHENYLGDRTVEAFSSFIEEFVSQHQHEAHNRAEPSQGAGRKLVGGQAVEAHTLDGEGCQIHGALAISRVPGNLRISAASADHSFNLGVMNVSHHVGPRPLCNPLCNHFGLAASGSAAHSTLLARRSFD